MLKIYNYKCPQCGEQREILDDREPDALPLVCYECCIPMLPFNFKSNNQRERIRDRYKKKGN